MSKYNFDVESKSKSWILKKIGRIQFFLADRIQVTKSEIRVSN